MEIEEDVKVETVSLEIQPSEVLLEAYFLYKSGFNVIPIRYGEKLPVGSWKLLETTRLPEKRLETVFNKTNLGVLVGKTSRNLFVIDCDNKDTFYEKIDELEKLGLAEWIVESPHGGHIWLISSDGEINGYKDENFQVWGTNHYILTPPSFNIEHGLPYKWMKRNGPLPPLVTKDKLVTIIPMLRLINSYKDHLPPKAHQVLVEKDITNYISDSEAEYVAVLSLVAKGYSDTEIIDVFDKYEPPHYISKVKPDKWLTENMIKKARIIVRIDLKNEKINQSMTWIRKHKWPGRSGSTDRKVLLACCQRAKMESPDDFRASIRELASLTGITTHTIVNSLKRLSTANFVRRKVITSKSGKKDILMGNHYILMDTTQYLHTISNCIDSVVVSSVPMDHDVWQYSALGGSCCEVYSILINEQSEKTIKELSDLTGKCTETIHRTLDKLLVENLVAIKDNKWEGIKVDIEVLDQIALKYNTLGISEKRKDFFRSEREERAYRILMGCQY